MIILGWKHYRTFSERRFTKTTSEMVKTNQSSTKNSREKCRCFLCAEMRPGHAAISPASPLSAYQSLLAAVVAFRPTNAVFTPGRASVGVRSCVLHFSWRLRTRAHDFFSSPLPITFFSRRSASSMLLTKITDKTAVC